MTAIFETSTRIINLARVSYVTKSHGDSKVVVRADGIQIHFEGKDARNFLDAYRSFNADESAIPEKAESND